jgi:hypothetical protein
LSLRMVRALPSITIVSESSVRIYGFMFSLLSSEFTFYIPNIAQF